MPFSPILVLSFRKPKEKSTNHNFKIRHHEHIAAIVYYLSNKCSREMQKTTTRELQRTQQKNAISEMKQNKMKIEMQIDEHFKREPHTLSIMH